MNPFLELLLFLATLIYSYLEAFVKLFVPVKRKSVSGELVLITGAGHGVGRATAFEFAKRHSRLVLWDINKHGVEDTAAECERLGATVQAFVVDCSKREEIYSAAEKVGEQGHSQKLTQTSTAFEFAKRHSRLVLWDINKVTGQLRLTRLRGHGVPSSVGRAAHRRPHSTSSHLQPSGTVTRVAGAWLNGHTSADSSFQPNEKVADGTSLPMCKGLLPSGALSMSTALEEEGKT
uniref:Estradiol 17-beta-dehydrogenase 11 n=1 Tax=Strix occidentalis caurina TaxID=311401 RepID=A0A8D0FYQ6_STROC